MDTSSPYPRCPDCQRPLALGRALGLCPRCLLARAALATEADPGASPPGEPEFAAVTAAFPNLEILDLIGRGGMGVVYRARQKSLNRLVALKLLAPGREQDPAFADRFAKEARALAALSHPNIVTVHDFGFAAAPEGAAGDGFYFLLMEFVDGVNLRQAMQAGRFTPEQALAIVPPVCGALQFAHERGIVHRDIKPENLLLNKDGQIKIADFGIAKMLETAGAEAPPRVSETDPSRTPPPPAFTVHTAAGTPHYMAPEQRDPTGGADHRADIYSLGVVLYELLTGELPGARLDPPSHRVQVDVRIDEIVLRALAVRPELRYATAGEFRTELETVVSTSGGDRLNSAESSKPAPRLLRSSRCYITTGEHLDSWWRKYIYMYSGQGRLTLDSSGLAFVGTFGDTVIPLGSIRDLRIGQYPRFMKPHGLDFIRVTFEQGGRTRSLCFVPNEGAWEPTWETNAFVAEWFTAIREARSAAEAQPRKATPPETPAGRTFSTVPQLIRASRGLLTTPENLSTLEGQFFIRRTHGQLLLDEHQLTHAGDRGTTAIPLAAIRDVSIGEYPATMNPAGIDLLSVTYEDQGGTKQVFISPMEGWFALPSTWNARVADWHAVLRNAVARATGKEPAETPRERVSVPPGHHGLRAFLLAALAIPALSIFLLLNLGNSSGHLFTPFAFILIMLLGGFVGQRLIWRFIRSSGPGSATTFSPGSRVAGTVLILLALALGWGLIAQRNQQAHAEAQGLVVKLQVAKSQEADFRAQLAEWTRRTDNAPDESQRSQLQIGRSRMQRELDDAIQRSQELERTLGQGVLKPDRSGPSLVVLPLFLGGLWLFLRPGRARPDARPRRWMQWLGGGLLVVGLPLGALGVWMGFQVANDPSWNPVPAEMFFAYAVWIGSAACLLGGLSLLAFARPLAGPPRSENSAVFVVIAAILLTGLLLVLVRPVVTVPPPPVSVGIGH